MVSFRFILLGVCASTAVAQRTCAPQVREEGESIGKTVQLNGIQTYITMPPGKTTTDTAILYLTDIFGIPLLQQRLLADSMAAANYAVVMPDLFAGDAIDPNAFGKPGFDFKSWASRHNVSTVDGIITKTIDSMKQKMGVKKIAAVGYCFGGKYVPRFLAQGKGVEVGFVAHPSSLTDEEIAAVNGPLSFAFADGDKGFPADKRENAAAVLQKKNETYQTTLYSGVEHGFAVKTDVSIKQKRFAKHAAFAQAISWFDVWLKDVENGYPYSRMTAF